MKKTLKIEDLKGKVLSFWQYEGSELVDKVSGSVIQTTCEEVQISTGEWIAIQPEVLTELAETGEYENRIGRNEIVKLRIS